MKTKTVRMLVMCLAMTIGVPALAAHQGDDATVKGELKQWHQVTLELHGPESDENATPNPFMDYRLNVTFEHPATGLTYVVPGYFAADGNAAETSATGGNVWRAHVSPDTVGEWTYSISFRKGKGIAVSEDSGEAVKPLDGKTGSFNVDKSDKNGRDFRAHGRLTYDGTRYLKLAGTGKIFLKAGADAPENFLAYKDFDGTFHNDGHKDELVKTWEPHVRDWKEGDPTWQGGKGKGMIGAINYLHDQGVNAFSFLTCNIIGDDQNVFPYTTYDERFRMDCSKLDQWGIVFEHGQRLGMFLHFKMLEAENQMLHDNGNTGPERKIYYRELVARYGHNLALNWNLCEEIGPWGAHKEHGQNSEQKRAMAQYLYDTDSYHHHMVIHNGVPFTDMLGDLSKLTGASVQTNRSDFGNVHRSLLLWINKSREAGKQWACAIDEPGDASFSLVPDDEDPARTNARGNALWGCSMAGGWGIEWYFGYKMPHSDLTCEDWRTRHEMWRQSKVALDFFNDNNLPLDDMWNHDELVGDFGDYCLADPGKIYVVYAKGFSAALDLSKDTGKYQMRWFNPRTGDYVEGETVETGGSFKLKTPGPHDWVAIFTR